MILISSKKTLKSICIWTLLIFTAATVFPAAAGAQPATARGDCSGTQRSLNTSSNIVGGMGTDEILALIKLTVPLSEELGNEMRTAVNSIMADAGDDPADPACSEASTLFLTGLNFVLLSIVISELVTKEVCVEEECIGDVCICLEEETTSPLSGLNKLLRFSGTVMMAFGVAAYVRYCVLATPVEER